MQRVFNATPVLAGPLNFVVVNNFNNNWFLKMKFSGTKKETIFYVKNIFS
jgi:hypothetical protein